MITVTGVIDGCNLSSLLVSLLAKYTGFPKKTSTRKHHRLVVSGATWEPLDFFRPLKRRAIEIETWCLKQKLVCSVFPELQSQDLC